MSIYRFTFTTGDIVIDYDRCKDCESYACVKACSLFGRAVLRVTDGKPVLTSADAAKRCIEDLTCEFYCQIYGKQGLKINLNMFGLNEYRERIGFG